MRTFGIVSRLRHGLLETQDLKHRIFLHGGAIALLIFVALFLTDPYFTVLDDETSIISAANAPIADTIKLFLTGQGQHEHPPLSDLLLHFWLPIAGVNPSLVRAPFMFLYAITLVVLSAVARKLSGQTGFYTTLLVGVFWPFGFHFGRMAGWYSFCFLLIAVLTLAYQRFLDAPCYSRWLLVIGIGLCLVASNYFGWAVIGLIAADMLISFRGRSPMKYLLPGFIVLVLGFGPLWIAFANEIQNRRNGFSDGAVSLAINDCFNLYSLFVSESIAPWFWKLSIVAGVAVVIVLVCTWRLIQGAARRLYLGFFVLYAVMMAIGILNIKRLLFISGWLLVPIGCALASPLRRRSRVLLASSLAIIAVLGWTGIVSRNFYSSPHFIEPWAKVADNAARQMRRGDMVVSNSAPFLLYLNSSLHDYGLSSKDRAGYATGPNIISLLDSGMPESSLKGEILFVRGVNVFDEEWAPSADSWMHSHCRLESTTKLAEDSGFALKRKFFHLVPENPYRITVEQFDCGN